MPHTIQDPSARRLDRWAIALCVLLPLLASYLIGSDNNWDLRNYHLYNPHAWLTGREAIDIAPAQLQSFHNPLLDVPLYLLVISGLSSWWTRLWLTLPAMASLYFLLRIQSLLLPRSPGRLSQLLLAMLAISGAATWSTLGSSMNDGFVAAGVLGCLALVCRPDADHHWQPWLFAGLIAGAIAGLKLTSSIYCAGLIAAALVGQGWSHRWHRVAGLAVGGVLGVSTTYAWWGWHLWARHGNPFFPYFNDVFKSPDALPLPWTDGRFLSHGVFDALTSPLQLLRKSQHYSELMLRDPRLFLGIVCLTTLLVLAYDSRDRKADSLRRPGALLAFFLVSWLAWVWQYGIYRYAAALELLGVLALMLVLQKLPRWRNTLMLVAALLVSADTRRPNWGRKNSEIAIAKMEAPALGTNAIVITATGDPLAYLSLGLPNEVPIIAIANNFVGPERRGGLQTRITTCIASHTGPIWLLEDPDINAGLAARALMRNHYALMVDSACKPYPNPLWPAQLCPVTRMGSPNAP